MSTEEIFEIIKTTDIEEIEITNNMNILFKIANDSLLFYKHSNDSNYNYNITNIEEQKRKRNRVILINNINNKIKELNVLLNKYYNQKNKFVDNIMKVTIKENTFDSYNKLIEKISTTENEVKQLCNTKKNIQVIEYIQYIHADESIDYKLYLYSLVN